MTYTVAFSGAAARQYRKLDLFAKRQIDNYIFEYLEGTTNPRAHGKPLKGNLIGFWRYQIGNFRLIVDIQDNILTIWVIKVGHRKEIYDGKVKRNRVQR
ncbi:MAG: type II toxin-antitoxin system RelE/ParE family toxin [Defluviitaleaceae bacterium]|nr:type II toxin-antitoxin system RelE/ParE family toxin [Defluviitaleaceae bacterium]